MQIAPVARSSRAAYSVSTIIARRLRDQGVARRRRRRVGRDRHHRPAQAERALRRQQDLARDRGARQFARRAVRARLDQRRRAVLGAAACAEQPGLAEQIDVGQRRAAARSRTALEATCSGARHRPMTLRRLGSRAARSSSSSRSASCAGAISVSQACSLICCSSTSLVERMMQHQRSARQQPDHQRGGEARKRHRRERRHHGCALRHVAFERHRKPAGDQAEMRARHRRESRPRSRRRRSSPPCGRPGSRRAWCSDGRASASSSEAMPSGRSLPKPQTWRIENASAAAFMARSA